MLFLIHQNKFSVYERAIYAALSGNLSQVALLDNYREYIS